MKKNFILTLALTSFVAFSCESKQAESNPTAHQPNNTQTNTTQSSTSPDKTNNSIENKKERTIITFRCDGFYNGIASEYIETVWLDTELKEVWYWNTSDEKKVKLHIKNIKKSNDEIGALSGEFSFPSSPNDVMDFVIIEDAFRILDPNDEREHEFIYEDSKSE